MKQNMNKRLKICIACSIGGHFTEIIELREVYEKYDYFFVTNPGVQTISTLANERTYFIPEKEEKKSVFLKQLFMSLKILLKEMPDVIVTTGSGDMFWICVLGKLLGSKVVYIESSARVTNPSKFGKFIYKFKIADIFIYQWEKLRRHYPNGVYGGLIFNFSEFVENSEILHEDSSVKYFIVVGTLHNDFSRLLRKVDELVERGVIKGEIYALIGHSKYIPKCYEYTDFIPARKFESKMRESDIVITHGGIGSIMTALKHGKKVIVVPRYRKFREIADDHQLDITRELEREGKIVAVYDIDDLEKAIRKVKTLKVRMKSRDTRIKRIIRDWLERET